jgi:hypothetical protein
MRCAVSYTRKLTMSMSRIKHANSQDVQLSQRMVYQGLKRRYIVLCTRRLTILISTIKRANNRDAQVSHVTASRAIRPPCALHIRCMG